MQRSFQRILNGLQVGRTGPGKLDRSGEKGLGYLPSPLSSVVLIVLPPCCSLNRQKNLVELSFLPGDTGKPDVFPASLGLPLLKQEERKMEAEEQEHKGEEEQQKKNQKRKGKKNEEGQEAVRPPGKEKSESQKPQAKKQGKRPRREPASEQVRPSGRMASLTGTGEHFRASQTPRGLLSDREQCDFGAGRWMVPAGAEEGALPQAASGFPWAGRVACHLSLSSSQEGVKKKQKKAAPSEEDDSGVEVYYREGEEEVEERSVLPKVRVSIDGERRRPWGGKPSVSCLRAGQFPAHPLLSLLVKYDQWGHCFIQGVGCIKEILISIY